MIPHLKQTTITSAMNYLHGVIPALSRRSFSEGLSSPA